MIKDLEKTVSEIKAHNKTQHNVSYDVLALFQQILNSEIQGKTSALHYVYNEIIDSEITDWFRKSSTREYSKYPEFVDWYTEKMTNAHMGKSTYIKATLSVSFNFSKDVCMRVIEKNFSTLSQDVFKSQVLSPLQNPNSKALHQRYADLYDYYMNKYVEKKDTIKELEVFSPDVQITLVDKLVKNKWFNRELYSHLQAYLYGLESACCTKMLGSIFKYESDVENLKLFEKQFISIIKNKTIEQDAFFKGVNGTREKMDYIFKSLIVDEQDYNKALDNNLTSKSNLPFKEEFNAFVGNVINAHFSHEKTLTQTQFLIIFKRCHGCGQAEQIRTIMDKLKENTPDLFNEIKNSLRSVSALTIYDDKVLDFSKEDIKKYVLTLLHNDLWQGLDKVDKPTRKTKI